VSWLIELVLSRFVFSSFDNWYDLLEYRDDAAWLHPQPNAMSQFL
jgi:hypothetical protein